MSSATNNDNDNVDTILMSNKSIRLGFIRKVYTLLAVELLIFFVFVMIGAFVSPLRNFVYMNPISALGISLGFFFSSFIPYIALACYSSVRMRVPTNYIVFNLFVLLLSAGVMMFTAMFEPSMVICAVGTTCALVIFLTLISFIPCFDITGWGLYLWMFSLVIMVYGFIATLMYVYLNMKIMYLVYVGLLIVITSVYLVFTTQLIIGGKKFEIGPDEYILGTIMLFTHIVTLFMSILSLFGSR